jgi:hypothetical protein
MKRDTKEFNSRFFEKRDHTGRYMVYSPKTGCNYYVEPMDAKDAPRVKHGDINPATGQIEGSYGEKYKGSIHPSESLITKENGFDDIWILPAGTSPNSKIEEIDELRYSQGYRPGFKPELTATV